MNDNNKKIFFDADKRNSQHSYNLNSFRGLPHNMSDKNKIDKEVKVLAKENTLRASSKKEKETDYINKGQIKPKLLTSCLPKAFEMKYGRNVTDNHDSNSPKKLILGKNINAENQNVPNLTNRSNNYLTHNENISNKYKLDSDEDRLINNLNPNKHKERNLNDDEFYREFFDESHIILKSIKNKKYDSDDLEKDKITKPIIIKYQISSIRQKSASPHLKEKIRQIHYLNSDNSENPISKKNNLSNNNLTPTSNGNEAKSTENNSNYSSSNCLQHNKLGNSRTHESFFPKIKKSYEMGIDNKERKETYEKQEIIDKLIDVKKSYRKLRFEENKSVKLETGITIGIINTKNKEIIKLFFHVPDFEIYSIKEIPMTSNNFIFDFKEKITNWNSKVGESNRFVKIYADYVNSPEGYLSVVTEYMNGYSLCDLIDQMGCLNEADLCKLTIQIVQGNVEYEEKFSGIFLEDLCSCKILFDKAGNLKIMPNFLNYFGKEYIRNNVMSLKAQCDCSFHFHRLGNILQNLEKYKKSKSNLHSEGKFVNISTSSYFKIGFLILISALGGHKFKSLDLIENLYTLRNDRLIEYDKLNFCCLIHLIISLENSCSIFTTKKMKISNFITRYKFSDNFFDFLCRTLSFSGGYDEIYKQSILNHQWLKVNNFINLNNIHSKVKINFKEMIKIVRDGKSSKNFGNESINVKNLANFLNNLEIILYNNPTLDHTELLDLMQFKKKVVKELSREFGVNRNELIEKIQNKINKSKR